MHRDFKFLPTMLTPDVLNMKKHAKCIVKNMVILMQLCCIKTWQ